MPDASRALPRDPSIDPVARLYAFFTISHLDLAQIILRQLVALRAHINPEHLRRVQPENLFLHLAGERAIAVLLDQLIWNLKSPKRLDLPLGRTVPDRIRPPEHVLCPARSDHFAPLNR